LENQHQKIKGYRELSQEEIDLMNEIKEHGEVTKALLNKINLLRNKECELAEKNAVTLDEELENLKPYSASIRCIDLAQDYLQTGQMWLVRSVALPESF
jgi:uncharacterized protein (UPF0335 family)